MKKSIAFVFPGQGSQEVGMGQAVAEQYPTAKQLFAQADELLGFPLSEICFTGPTEELDDTINTQVAVFSTSIAILHALREAGFTDQPHFVAGHSLGEYSAYVAAGVLSFTDGLQLIRTRGRLMKRAGELNPGGMAAILKLDPAKVVEVCQQVTAEKHGVLQVANFNSADQVVVSGHIAAVERGIELAREVGARRAIRLAVSVAPHSELMQIIANDFYQVIEALELNLPEIPIVANITASPLNSMAEIRAEMAGQLTAAVRWTDTIEYMIAQGVTEFIEIGPTSVLSGLIRRIDRSVKRHSIRTPEDIQQLLEQL